MASSLKSPVERLKGLGRKLRGDAEGAAFELGEHRFSGLKLLEKLPGRMWSRAGRLS